jgi:flagellar hook assembly protein FlgD
VFVDDEAIRTGQTGTLVGDVCRTWYDGVSYAEVGNGSVVSVSKEVNVPKEFVLGQNYPNPFNPMTTIDYSLPEKGYVSLKVYNLVGQEVATLVSKEMPAGSHRINWNAQNLPSGVYFYRITVGSYSNTDKMVLLK